MAATSESAKQFPINETLDTSTDNQHVYTQAASLYTEPG